MEIKKIFDNKKPNSNDDVYDKWKEFMKARKKRDR
jgi:hypothetical protein